VLKKLISDMTLRKEVGRAARETMIKRHSWQATAERVISVLDGVLRTEVAPVQGSELPENSSGNSSNNP
jgi:hypothetical protein